VKRSSAALSLILLVGCQKFLTIVVDDTRSLQPTFRFHSESVFGTRNPQVVHVSTFMVTEKGQQGVPDTTVWHIESPAAKISAESGMKPSALREITYGKPPTGYATVVAPQSLAWGKTYRITSSLKVEGDDAVVGAGGEFAPSKP
jgi:hypothetical protein